MPYNHHFRVRNSSTFQPGRSLDIGVKPNSSTRTRIRISIPQDYHGEPVISHLASDHGVTVNITRASLSTNRQGEGRFDLELYGKAHQIRRALGYLQALEIDIKGKPNPDGDSW